SVRGWLRLPIRGRMTCSHSKGLRSFISASLAVLFIRLRRRVRARLMVARAVDLAGQSEAGFQLSRHRGGEVRKHALRARPGACGPVEGQRSKDVADKDPEPLAEHVDIVLKPAHALREPL